MKKRNVLLTGAVGTVGYEALQQLVAKEKYEVTVFDVETSKAKELLTPFQEKVNICYGDIRNKEEVKKAVQGQDVIIHLAAIIPPLADEKPELARAVNTGGTQNILETMDADTFLLYASSVSVYGDRVENPMISVSDSLQPSIGDYYAETKVSSEKKIRESGKKWSIFRLSAIMGYGNHKVSGHMFHMPLETSLEITTPEDTARAFVNALEHEEELLLQTFNLGGGAQNRTTYKDFLQRSFDAFGLGELDFPEKSFAEKNFHCGYYADGDILEEILHFRKDTLCSYFEKVRERVSALKRFFANALKGIVKNFLLRKSEPYHAYRANNKSLMNHYFKTE